MLTFGPLYHFRALTAYQMIAPSIGPPYTRHVQFISDGLQQRSVSIYDSLPHKGRAKDEENLLQVWAGDGWEAEDRDHQHHEGARQSTDGHAESA